MAADRTAQLQRPLLPERVAGVYAEVRNGVARFHGLTVEHDDARRGLRLLPARHLPRARRHDRAHPRREVPPAAARRVDGRLAARLLPVGGAAEVALRLRGLPAPVPRRPAARSTSPSSSSSSATSRARCASRSSACTTRCTRSARRRPTARSTPAIAASGRSSRAHDIGAGLQAAACTSFFRTSSNGSRKLHAALAMDYFEAQVTERPCAT